MNEILEKFLYKCNINENYEILRNFFVREIMMVNCMTYINALRFNLIVILLLYDSSQ